MNFILHINNLGKGYVSGFSSSITSSAVQNLGGGKVATVIGGGLTGGVGAAVSGGNFFQGATYGLIASSLNHIAHEILVSTSAGPGDPPTKEQLEIMMYEEYAAGRCSQIEYLYSLDVINNNPLGILQTLWEYNKVEIATTVAGMGFAKFLGIASKGSSWVYGAFKSEAKWAGQLSKRGWTAEQITEAVTKGKSFDAVNMVNKANSATRYVHPTTGQSVIIDNVTKELLHVGGPGFKY